ncbi:flagellar motor switch protein FliM [Crateriforma conspicua]|uniref:Flagellar motor switch protein FliM n=1 Tax=Crateriforma conspicua TaxID=2527996 RepID=A0A5C5YF10_9PLAN|nr:flagellar motor switch protein FliM [Crateriforma conspicua]QDV61898.1 Flagellar motor switch protein FliM [Crateriforma conspicua]TWT71852.1 Flagellar motor switch protein FliM [Crateriforma conspicua]
MSDESLSQNQVESLLRAMEGMGDDDGPPEAPKFTDEGPPEPVSAGVRTASARQPSGAPYHHGVGDARVMAYDFKRPERVGKEQMRAMQSLHEVIARNFGASVSGMLRTMIEVKLLSVDQLTYSEFVFSLDNPSCFNVISTEPLDGHWILDINPALSYTIIDRMLGGDPVPGDVIRRPLTEIETRLMNRVVKLFLSHLKDAWQNIIELDLSVESTESNPQLVQIVPPNEVVILVSFEIVIGKNRGMLNLCIPFNTVEKYNSQLSRNGWVGYGREAPTEESRRQIEYNLDEAPVNVVVTLARSKINTSDLLALNVGDVIATEKEVTDSLELSIQDVHKFNVRAGAFKGKKAVRIDTVAEKPQRNAGGSPPR